MYFYNIASNHYHISINDLSKLLEETGYPYPCDEESIRWRLYGPLGDLKGVSLPLVIEYSSNHTAEYCEIIDILEKRIGNQTIYINL